MPCLPPNCRWLPAYSGEIAPLGECYCALYCCVMIELPCDGDSTPMGVVVRAQNTYYPLAMPGLPPFWHSTPTTIQIDMPASGYSYRLFCPGSGELLVLCALLGIVVIYPIVLPDACPITLQCRQCWWKGDYVTVQFDACQATYLTHLPPNLPAMKSCPTCRWWEVPWPALTFYHCQLLLFITIPQLYPRYLGYYSLLPYAVVFGIVLQWFPWWWWWYQCILPGDGRNCSDTGRVCLPPWKPVIETSGHYDSDSGIGEKNLLCGGDDVMCILMIQNNPIVDDVSVTIQYAGNFCSLIDWWVMSNYLFNYPPDNFPIPDLTIIMIVVVVVSMYVIIDEW